MNSVVIIDFGAGNVRSVSYAVEKMGRKAVITSDCNTIQNAEKVYALHMGAVENRKLITDRSTLEREVLQLVPKANGVYEKALEAMKAMEDS